MTISFLACSRCAISLRWPRSSELLSKTLSSLNLSAIWSPSLAALVRSIPPADAVGGRVFDLPRRLGQAGHAKPRLRGSLKTPALGPGLDTRSERESHCEKPADRQLKKKERSHFGERNQTTRLTLTRSRIAGLGRPSNAKAGYPAP
jgi:hypothetical protein